MNYHRYTVVRHSTGCKIIEGENLPRPAFDRAGVGGIARGVLRALNRNERVAHRLIQSRFCDGQVTYWVTCGAGRRGSSESAGSGLAAEDVDDALFAADGEQAVVG